MKAIYDSGIPVNFKGSMVLKACLMEAGCLIEHSHDAAEIYIGLLFPVIIEALRAVKEIKNAVIISA